MSAWTYQLSFYSGRRTKRVGRNSSKPITTIKIPLRRILRFCSFFSSTNRIPRLMIPDPTYRSFDKATWEESEINSSSTPISVIDPPSRHVIGMYNRSKGTLRNHKIEKTITSIIAIERKTFTMNTKAQGPLNDLPSREKWNSSLKSLL